MKSTAPARLYDFTGHFNQTIIVVIGLERPVTMKTAAVSELKARLSEYLSRVKAGEEVLITDRGNAVARLVPISRAVARRDTLEGMERRGLIKLGAGKLPKGFWGIPKPEDPGGSVLKALMEEREKGR